ncbi:MAG: hypothetical protein Q9164_002061 [Protoblastenia rupestris]
MFSAPLPSTLTLLSQLPQDAPGSKLRFLGCVTSYNSRAGILELQHSCPHLSSTAVIAMVDLNLLLENINREDMEIGAWVNVVGYLGDVATDTEESNHRRKRVRDEEFSKGRRTLRVEVQAVLLWNAGGVKLTDYEKAVEERTRTARKIKP